jgi:hypothetical protein
MWLYLGPLLTITVLLGAVAIVRLRGRRKPRAMKMMARRLVSDPEYARSVSSRLAARAEAMDVAQAAPPPPYEAIPTLVQQLLCADTLEHDVARVHLEKVKIEAESALLAAFDDPRCTWKREGSHAMDSAPAERVANLLQSIPSRALGERLAELVDHSEWHVYSKAVQARAALGRPDLVPFVIQQMEAGSIRQSSAEKGVALAIRHGWAQPGFIEELFAWAKETTLNPAKKHSAWAVKFFAEHGGVAAIEALQSPDVLSLENNRTIHFALEELNQRSIAVEPTLLNRFIEKSLASATQWPWQCVFRPALKSLALTHPSQALGIAESQIDNDHEQFSRAAVDFAREWHGLPETWRIDPLAAEMLSVEDRAIVARLVTCRSVFAEVANGGLSQYFFNTSGDEWPRAVEALRAIGFPEGAEALERAARIVHPDGASTNRDVRMGQYARLSEAAEAKLDEFDSLFWKADDPVTLRYMLRHRDLFQRLREVSKALSAHADDNENDEDQDED